MTEAQYLDLSADELTERNILLKRDREAGHNSEEFEESLAPILRDDSTIKAVIVSFCDLEGKLHMLDYNKDFFLESRDNLTFDGSSINGFTELNQSDLRLFPDWTSFRWLPASIFGPGKVMVFGRIANQDGSDYENDMRSRLASLSEKLRKDQDIRVFVAPEIEGHLLAGTDAEQTFTEENPYDLATTSGYFSALPQDDLRQFIDTFARSLGMLGFEMEKDHPEVSPSEFEVNWKFTDALHTADQILLYKLVARQVAKTMGYTSSFLPKPVVGLNGNGMHTNMSLSKGGKNVFFDGADSDKLSRMGKSFAAGILTHAKDICLMMCSSVNSYRRLDPNFEAPNEIKMSSRDRGSMIRIPVGNERSARVEVRVVSPDSNPYLIFFALIKAGLKGVEHETSVPEAGEILPSSIHESLEYFEKSEYVREMLGRSVHGKYIELKRQVADRAAREHGNIIKTGEVIFHHEVTNQYLWDQF